MGYVRRTQFEGSALRNYGDSHGESPARGCRRARRRIDRSVHQIARREEEHAGPGVGEPHCRRRRARPGARRRRRPVVAVARTRVRPRRSGAKPGADGADRTLAHGVLLGSGSFPAAEGYRGLLDWTTALGQVRQAVVEGTYSYDAALTRHLLSVGIGVIMVSQANKAHRRCRGKTDAIDAEQEVSVGPREVVDLRCDLREHPAVDCVVVLAAQRGVVHLAMLRIDTHERCGAVHLRLCWQQSCPRPSRRRRRAQGSPVRVEMMEACGCSSGRTRQL